MAFNIGDVVRVGKGKVEYTVTWTPESKGMDEGYDLEVQSHNTGNLSRVGRNRLVLVKAVEDIERDAKPETDGPLIPGTQPNPAPELDSDWHDMRTPEEAKLADMEQDMDTQKAAELKGTVQSPLDEHTSYQKTILGALNTTGKHVFGGLSLSPRARARRKARRQAAKISRKANR